MSSVASSSAWGAIRLVPIDTGSDFWALMNELQNDQSGFWHNRRIIADAFRGGALFGLRVDETDAMYTQGARQDPTFMKETWYMLPCFCVKSFHSEVDIVWVHSRCRRRGFGKEMVSQLEISGASDVLPGSEPFWAACGITIKSRSTTNFR